MPRHHKFKYIMKTLQNWISFFVYLWIWVFIFKLFDLYLKEKKYTDKETKRLCIGRLIVLCIIYNTSYIK